MHLTGRSNERIELVKAVASIAENPRELQQPVRTLVGNMSKEDEIQMPGIPQAVKKNAAKESLAKATRSRPSTYYIDHRYIVQELSTKKPGQWQITIAYGDVSFRAKLLISDTEVSSLLKDFQEAHAKGSEIAPDMQVTAEM